MLKAYILKVRCFLKDKHTNPILAILMAGLYALLYYYDKNYALINSKPQFIYLASLYFILPLVSYYIIQFFLSLIIKKKTLKLYLISMFNLITFFGTIVISLYAFDLPKLLIAAGLGLFLGYLLKDQLKKVMVVQGILVVMVLPKLIPDFYREITYSKKWMQQPDTIETATFKKRPNIYLIQPDGYASFNTFNDAIHDYDNSVFENFLVGSGFKIYNDYRSNYFSTLTSNSALFAMKHHYYGNTSLGINPRHNRRNEIVESNPVLRTLKHNNYKTFLMLQVPYLLSNRPDIDYDYCNISLDEVSYISRGFNDETNLAEETKQKIKEHKDTQNFFFIESMLPSHITTRPNSESSVENERTLYLRRIEEANSWLKDLVTYIERNDPNALIIIAADHGGFVGFNYSLESKIKTDNPLLVNSIFSSLLAIKWPNNEMPKYDDKIKTSVNLFRILFSYLSDNTIYLEHLQDDKSYIILRKDSPTGVYEYMDAAGEAVLKKK